MTQQELLPIPKSSWAPLPIPPDLSSRGFYVGTSGYHFDDWIGRFNPPRPKAHQRPYLDEDEAHDQDRLLFYQKYFSFAEINSTFYQEATLDMCSRIAQRSKESMMYTVKLHKDISHTKNPNIGEGREAIDRHVTAVSPLLETGRFYSFLLQLDDRLPRSQAMLDYLLAVGDESISHEVDLHIEFRHISWHAEPVLRALKNAGIGICNTDIPPLDHAFPLKSYATSDKGYIRYSGRNLTNWYPPSGSPKKALERRNMRYDYCYSEDEIADIVKGQKRLWNKTTTVALAYNNHFNAQAVKNAIENLDMLKATLKQTESATRTSQF